MIQSTNSKLKPKKEKALLRYPSALKSISYEDLEYIKQKYNTQTIRELEINTKISFTKIRMIVKKFKIEESLLAIGISYNDMEYIEKNFSISTLEELSAVLNKPIDVIEYASKQLGLIKGYEPILKKNINKKIDLKTASGISSMYLVESLIENSEGYSSKELQRILRVPSKGSIEVRQKKEKLMTTNKKVSKINNNIVVLPTRLFNEFNDFYNKNIIILK